MNAIEIEWVNLNTNSIQTHAMDEIYLEYRDLSLAPPVQQVSGARYYFQIMMSKVLIRWRDNCVPVIVILDRFAVNSAARNA